MGCSTNSASGYYSVETPRGCGIDTLWSDRLSTKVWSKATKIERKRLIMQEVKKKEEESYMIKAVSQFQQVKWTTWEAVIGRNITWDDLWKLPQTRLSFLIRATYDTLPSPRTCIAGIAQKSFASFVATRVPAYNTFSLAVRLL
ncbi:solute carrier family facilitated glucose transporter member 11-like protein [Labeo rohita]|uniref:Solute carrier family facilitated glucose transporter member 11-like protein n=1 Tax=Labeo rohita TaxID=84645 RepID=A0A498L8X4_LABRO|nr:solute carrier family facilitated glucose transporter member 11-like protein [Labeo rohita]